MGWYVRLIDPLILIFVDIPLDVFTPSYINVNALQLFCKKKKKVLLF